MMTVKEVSDLTGVSVRTLHYYDRIGLLPPSRVTDAGYRLYGDNALERLQHILLFRELEFPLKEIHRILDAPGFEKNRALEQQIALLKLKKEHLENLIQFALGIKQTGVNTMDFSAFDKSKIEEYAKRAKEQWGDTESYQEFAKKAKDRNSQEESRVQEGLMNLFVDFGKLAENDPSSARVQDKVRQLQDYISEYFYHCTDEILAGLGQMYGAGGEFTENINQYAGSGAAEFAAAAIAVSVGKKGNDRL